LLNAIVAAVAAASAIAALAVAIVHRLIPEPDRWTAVAAIRNRAEANAFRKAGRALGLQILVRPLETRDPQRAVYIRTSEEGFCNALHESANHILSARTR
jgi:hypothetical protein